MFVYAFPSLFFFLHKANKRKKKILISFKSSFVLVIVNVFVIVVVHVIVRLSLTIKDTFFLKKKNIL